MKKTWGHDQLATDLALHLMATRDRVVWENMQLGPAGSPRPDVYSMPKAYAKFRPLAYEIKVSVSDYRSDITSGKWQSYLKYASAVIFCVPAGLIKKEDLPAGCGLMYRHDEVWRTVKGPTMNHVETLPRDAWMKLMIDGIERQHKQFRDEFRGQYSAHDKIGKKYGKEIGGMLYNRDLALSSLQTARDKAVRTREEIEAEEKERVRHIRAQVERDARIVNDVHRGLIQVLGLPEDASIYDVSYEANKLLKLLRDGEEMKRMKLHLDNAIQNLQQAAQPIMQLPELKNPDNV